MLVYNSHLLGTPILSVQAGGPIASLGAPIVDPDNLKIIAFRVSGPPASSANNILDVASIREYSSYGIVIDSIDEFVAPSDVVRIEQVLGLNFDLLSLKVETKKGSKLGTITDFTVNSDDFLVQQIIVKRPTFKRLLDPELTISRREIVEVTDYKIIVKDEEKTLKSRAEKEDFIPNFVNPFREAREAAAHAETSQTDTENQE
jgi:sporulation protein YlmC with PRC-barrel domain